MENTEEVKRAIERLKSMLRSLYCYGGLDKDNSYLDSYRKDLSKEDFDNTYDEYSKYLKETFTIDRDTYTDREGCTYNSLIEK